MKPLSGRTTHRRRVLRRLRVAQPLGSRARGARAGGGDAAQAAQQLRENTFVLCGGGRGGRRRTREANAGPSRHVNTRGRRMRTSADAAPADTTGAYGRDVARHCNVIGLRLEAWVVRVGKSRARSELREGGQRGEHAREGHERAAGTRAVHVGLQQGRSSVCVVAVLSSGLACSNAKRAVSTSTRFSAATRAACSAFKWGCK